LHASKHRAGGEECKEIAKLRAELAQANSGRDVLEEHALELNEGDRQMVLMALAHLSVERPGWDDALNTLALQIDNQSDGRALMYDDFRTLHRRAVVAERKGSSRS